jgi:hypothetical protein
VAWKETNENVGWKATALEQSNTNARIEGGNADTISRTAGEPKAIPWTHVTPIRCGVDAWAQQDVRRGDVAAWPTNLGWMMGAWLLYAAMLNGAAVALFQVCHHQA